MSELPKRSMWIDKPVEELIWYLAQQGEPGSRAHEEVKGAVAHALVKGLCDTINKHEIAATRLANRLLWLNVILGAFTVAGTALTIISLVK